MTRSVGICPAARRPWLCLHLIGICLLVACDGAVGTWTDSSVRKQDGLADGPTRDAPGCFSGTDKDGDGYGEGCPRGNDCDDSDPYINPGATEICDGKDNNCDNNIDEGVLNACGTCEPGCSQVGAKPFPINSGQDPGVRDVNGVGLDPNGDLVLDKDAVDFNYMWIANTNDLTRGTISKIDTRTLKEVARYFTVTCFSQKGAAAGTCNDLHGKPIQKDGTHTPSRTAVDFNFDVWVANRFLTGGGVPSATKIANAKSDCIDRDGNGKIETSGDRNGDGTITVDCDGDSHPDNRTTVCTGALAGKEPEFYGDDDECLLFTVTYGAGGDLGRSICLGSGGGIGASDAWVGTNIHKNAQGQNENRFYRINGQTGALSGPYNMPLNFHPYGCVVDRHNILWAVALDGHLALLNTLNPTQTAGPLVPPWADTRFYGITLDSKNHIWLGGWESYHVYRYKPNRSSFAGLSAGTWTGIKQPAVLQHSRGIAADNRGKIWVAINNGYIWRVDQNIADGLHDLSADTNYWAGGGTGIIGVGIDFTGHVWGISYDNSLAARLDIDASGNPKAGAPAMTDPARQVPVGTNPYTYSDFTGFGLKNFTRSEGRYRYQLSPCANQKKAEWTQVKWNATTPASTTIEVRVRSGDSDTSFGNWVGPFSSSPADIGKGAATPIAPNPARILQLEFIFKSQDQTTSAILHDFDVSYDCTQGPG
jgi:hypothetical protein